NGVCHLRVGQLAAHAKTHAEGHHVLPEGGVRDGGRDAVVRGTRIPVHIRGAQIGLPVVHRDVGQRGAVVVIAARDVVPVRRAALVAVALVVRPGDDAAVLVIAADEVVGAVGVLAADVVPVAVRGEDREVLAAGQVGGAIGIDRLIGAGRGEVLARGIQGLAQRRITHRFHPVQVVEPVLTALPHEQATIGLHRNDVVHRTTQHLLGVAAGIQAHEAHAVILVQCGKGLAAAGLGSLHAGAVVLVPVGVVLLLGSERANAPVGVTIGGDIAAV